MYSHWFSKWLKYIYNNKNENFLAFKMMQFQMISDLKVMFAAFNNHDGKFLSQRIFCYYFYTKKINVHASLIARYIRFSFWDWEVFDLRTFLLKQKSSQWQTFGEAESQLWFLQFQWDRNLKALDWKELETFRLIILLQNQKEEFWLEPILSSKTYLRFHSFRVCFYLISNPYAFC